MKKNIYLFAGFVLMSFIFTSLSVFAADKIGTVKIDAEKIGFINLRVIIANASASKKSVEDFQKLFTKKNEAVQMEEKELMKMKDALEKQSSVLTPVAKNEKTIAYQKKLRNFQILVDDTNKDLELRYEEIGAKYYPEIMEVVKKIIEREKYTLVIDPTKIPILYYAKENDFSKKVIDEYDKQQKSANTKK
jgi:outer membrane protein